MHSSALTTTTLLTLLAATTHAISSQHVYNHCNESIYVTFINSTQGTDGPREILGTANNNTANTTWFSEIVGVGNSLGISKSQKYWSKETPKLVLGTSTDLGVLYWAVGKVDGDPFEGEKWSLGSGEKNVCENATMYDAGVHGCQDQEVVLALDLC